jgi:hypothetical protein
MVVDLEDGRRIGVPIVWFPRLVQASPKQREGWRLIGRGIGISWGELDEDISVEGLLATRDEVILPVPRPPQPPQPPPAGRRHSSVVRDRSGRFVRTLPTATSPPPTDAKRHAAPAPRR